MDAMKRRTLMLVPLWVLMALAGTYALSAEAKPPESKATAPRGSAVARPTKATKTKDASAANWEDERSAPGVATGGTNAPHIKGDWLRGSHGNAGVVPAQVATKLRGKKYEKFAEFRADFWRMVAATPELKSQFNADNQHQMADGNSPLAVVTQQIGKRKRYELHHKIPLHAAGELYKLDNILVVTPVYHREVLDPAFHYKKGGGK